MKQRKKAEALVAKAKERLAKLGVDDIPFEEHNMK